MVCMAYEADQNQTTWCKFRFRNCLSLSYPERPQRILESPLHMITWLFLLTNVYIKADTKQRRRLSSQVPLIQVEAKSIQHFCYNHWAFVKFESENKMFLLQFSTATNQASGGLMWRWLVRKESELWGQGTPQVWLEKLKISAFWWCSRDLYVRLN